MVKINNVNFGKIIGNYENKTQILLSHTGRGLNNYMSSLKYRYSGNSTRIPTYIISKKGEMFQLMKHNEYSRHYPDIEISKKQISICLENLGWLEKKPMTNEYINWIGDIYNGEVFQRKYRDYYYWDIYTEVQYEMLNNVLETIFNDTKIKRIMMGHNVYNSNTPFFHGIVSKSNFKIDCTDINPSFDFKKIKL